MINDDLAQNGWVQMGQEPTNADLESFREAYKSIVEVAVDRARNQKQPHLISLLEFVMLKHLLQVVGSEIEQLRHQLQDRLSTDTTQSKGKSLEIHERLVFLAKHEPALRYRVSQRLFRIVQQMESTGIRKIRKSVLGKSWPVPKEILFNPLLQMNNLQHDELTMDHYPLLCTGKDGARYFAQVNKALIEVFSSFLPDWLTNKTPSAEKITSHGSHAGQPNQHRMAGHPEIQSTLDQVMSQDEYSAFRTSWLDNPENMMWLLQAPESSAPVNRSTLQDSVGTEKQWSDFRQRTADRLFSLLTKAKLVLPIIVSSRTPRLYRQLHGRVAVRDIQQYLVGELPKRQLVRRLSVQYPEQDPAEAIRAMDAVANHIRRMSAAKEREYCFRFIKEFLTLRRDLKHAYFASSIMGRFRLLTAKSDLSLSRANHTLYDFSERAPVGEKTEGQVRAHVILKADIRGSTETTRSLLAKKLNPASHFSINFFEPITKLLDDFGAVKVFVEGDALILTILEYEGVSFHWLTVAHACGLARKILAVMDAQNAQNRAHGLPQLELGLGIAFNDEPPAYLYDDRRKIMISTAINQADRLSSCSPSVRRQLSRDASHPNRTEVLLARHETASGVDDYHDKLVRFNVNGIELDAPAFFKLKSELVLHRVRIRDRQTKQSERYHVGRYPDLKGTTHWLVVREAPVRVWDGRSIGDEEPNGRRFYEVITEPKLIARVKAKLSPDRKKKACTDDARQ